MAPQPTNTPRSGRRPGSPATRAQIVDAAREAFAQTAYSAVSLRGVARSAGVDPALVIHFFGSKAGLFIAAIGWPFDADEEMRAVVADGPAHLGRNMAAMFVEHWEREGERSPIIGMLHVATGEPAGAGVMRDYLAAHMLAPLIATTTADQPELRAGLVAAHLVGMGIARYVLAFEPLASAPPATVIAALAAPIQHALDDPLPE